MKPFRLNIIGNICSGKSELIDLIKKDFENAEYFSIDEYRKEHGSFDKNSDALVWERFIEDCTESPFSVTESSGTSRYFKHIRGIARANVIVVLLECPDYISLDRFKKRPISNSQISKKFNIVDSVEYIEKKLKNVSVDLILNSLNTPQTLYSQLMHARLQFHGKTISETMTEYNELNK
jgi:dephospho-CoA kinase